MNRFRCIVPLLAAAVAFPSAGCRQSASSAPPPPEVQVAPVLRQDVPVFQEYVATTDGYVNAAIRAQVTGYLVRQAYREGDVVRKGQLLFEIDPRPFRAALAQAEARLEQARGELAQAGGRVAQAESQIGQAAGQRAQAVAQHANARATLDRVLPLAAQNAVSRKDLDDAVGAEGSTRAAVEAADANVKAADANVTAAQAGVVAAKGSVAAAQAAVDRARLDLGFTRVVSPIDGIAGIAAAQVGNLVGPGQGGELATVSQVDPIKVYFDTSEQAWLARARRFRNAEAANARERERPHELILADGSVYPHKGRFLAVDRQVDARTGTLRVAVLFPNPGNLIRPGQFARIRVEAETKRQALLVPQRAVTELQGGFQVAVVGADDRVDVRTVKPAERVCALWVVDEGLSPGDRVVVEGIQKAKQGAPVTPKPVPPELLARLEAAPDPQGRCVATAR